MTEKDALARGVERGEEGPIKNFVGMKNGKPMFEGEAPSKNIFGPQNAHSVYKSTSNENKVAGYFNFSSENGERKREYYAKGDIVASATASINIKHTGGSPDATVTSRNIRGNPSKGNEGRSNVNIKHERE